MGRRKSTAEKQEKKTPVKVRPIARKHAGKITEPWKIMEDMVDGNPIFEHLKVAKIKLWWQKDWKADVDGIATGAQVCKASEIDRNLVEEGGTETVDLFIKLPENQWPTLDETEKRHRLFHELCHIRPACNSEGKQKRDAKDRLLWRLRRHPIAAFPEEIEEFGIDRVLGHNEAVLQSIGHTDRPMEKIFDAAEKADAKPNGDGKPAEPDAWKALDIGELHPLSVTVHRKMTDAGLTTLGKLSAAMDGDQWWRDIAGIGAPTAEKIGDAFTEFWAAHPEYCRD